MSSRIVGKLSGSGLAAVDRIVGFLHVRHPAKTGICVEAETRGRITAEQFRKWDERVSRPGFDAIWALIDTYGPEIIAAAFEQPPEWLDAVLRARKLADVERRLAELQAERASLSAPRLSLRPRNPEAVTGA